MKVKMEIIANQLCVVSENGQIMCYLAAPTLHYMELDEYPRYMQTLGENLRLSFLDYIERHKHDPQ